MQFGLSNEDIGRLLGIHRVSAHNMVNGRFPMPKAKRQLGSVAKLGARQLRRAVLNPYAWRKWLEHREMPRKK